MSVLDEINYYEGREEGELTPPPSDEDDPELLESGVIVIYSGRNTFIKRGHQTYRRTVPANSNEAAQRIEILKKTSELRLRLLVLKSLGKKRDTKSDLIDAV
jgi:hypothetical protein